MFPLAKAEEVLRDRIERGNQVLANLRQSYTSRTKDPAKYLPFYENWKEFNTDLLGRMFSDPNYKLEYLNRIQRIAAPHTAPQLPYRLLTSINSLNEEIRCLSSILERLSLLEHHPTSSNNQVTEPEAVIFIGHGRSVVWRELRDFIRDRLHMSFEEFNRVSPAGISVTDRLTEMLGRADFAFLLLTGEDEQPDGSLNARLNVVHEAGLFQGKLGFRRAIVLLEEGCQGGSSRCPRVVNM